MSVVNVLKVIAQSVLANEGEPTWESINSAFEAEPCKHLQKALALRLKLDEANRLNEQLRQRLEDLAAEVHVLNKRRP